MPHTPPSSLWFSRRCGHSTLSLTAPEESGLPSGVYPRRILAWMTTQALRAGSPYLEIGPRSSWALTALGITPTFGAKGTVPALRAQLQKLCHMTVRITMSQPAGGLGPPFGRDLGIASSFNAFGENAYVELTPAFFAEICQRPIPVDLHVLKELRSPLATDAYVLLTYRAIRSQRLRRPEPVRWSDLRDQLGCQFRQVRQFRHAFLAAIEKVLPFYPDVRVRHDGKHFTFLPYPPHVPRLDLLSASSIQEP
jgi:hypothetical protein